MPSSTHSASNSFDPNRRRATQHQQSKNDAEQFILILKIKLKTQNGATFEYVETQQNL